ncbi:lipocalin family protein [Dyadobacter sp.]|uniref:lipocalin family protein n=1 Tax=Dyadobacter sp. TaxID=1914288 RepID=UPI003F6F9D49
MKKMSLKNLSAFLLSLVLVAGVFSCKDDSENPKPNEPEPVNQNKVEGSWKIKAMTIEPAVNGITDMLAFYEALAGNNCLSQTTITFNGNGKVTGKVPAGCVEDDDSPVVGSGATWKVVGNKIQVIEDGETDEFDLEVKGNEMKWSVSETEDGQTFKTTLVFKK